MNKYEGDDVCAYCGKPPEQGKGWLAHTRGRHVHVTCEWYRENRADPHDYERPDIAHVPPEEA